MATKLPLKVGLIGGQMEVGSASLSGGSCDVTTFLGNVAFAQATYLDAATVEPEGPVCDLTVTDGAVTLSDALHSGDVRYVLIGNCDRYGGIGGFPGGGRWHVGTARMVAGSADIPTPIHKVHAAFMTFMETTGTANQTYCAKSRTETTGGYVTFLTPNMNALSADINYLIIGD